MGLSVWTSVGISPAVFYHLDDQVYWCLSKAWQAYCNSPVVEEWRKPLPDVAQTKEAAVGGASLIIQIRNKAAAISMTLDNNYTKDSYNLPPALWGVLGLFMVREQRFKAPSFQLQMAFWTTENDVSLHFWMSILYTFLLQEAVYSCWCVLAKYAIKSQHK